MKTSDTNVSSRLKIVVLKCISTDDSSEEKKSSDLRKTTMRKKKKNLFAIDLKERSKRGRKKIKVAQNETKSR